MRADFSLISVFIEPDRGFTGNTAAVVNLDNALPDKEMQAIASDFNQPATTFLWKDSLQSYQVRWFAPDGEIGLCGHGSLAATAWWAQQSKLADFIKLKYRTGEITGQSISKDRCSIRLSAIPRTEELDIPLAVSEGLGVPILDFFSTANKYIVVTDSVKSVKDMSPDFNRLRTCEIFGYTVTAKGDETDFVSRTIVPHVQALEDPATGSSHAAIAPFWTERLGKDYLTALQLSKRGGYFICQVTGDEVTLTGKYQIWATGSLHI